MDYLAWNQTFFTLQQINIALLSALEFVSESKLCAISLFARIVLWLLCKLRLMPF